MITLIKGLPQLGAVHAGRPSSIVCRSISLLTEKARDHVPHLSDTPFFGENVQGVLIHMIRRRRREATCLIAFRLASYDALGITLQPLAASPSATWTHQSLTPANPPRRLPTPPPPPAPPTPPDPLNHPSNLPPQRRPPLRARAMCIRGRRCMIPDRERGSYGGGRWWWGRCCWVVWWCVGWLGRRVRGGGGM